jgi:hypothetical protein
MFKNRSIQMKFVKDADNIGTEDAIVNSVDPAEIAKIATDYTVKTIGAIGAVVAANKVLSTICEIAVITAKAKIK